MSTQYAPRYVLLAKNWITVTGLAIIGFVASLIGGVVFMLTLPESYGVAATGLGAGAGLTLAVLIYFERTGKTIDYIDFDGFSPRALGLGVLVGLLLVAIQGGLTLLFTSLGIGEPFGTVAETIQEAGFGMLVGMILVSFLVTAPAEELLYRNVIQKELYKNHSTAVAVLGAGVLFTFIHFPDLLVAGGTEMVTGAIEILVNALIYGAVYAYWKRIDVTIVAHGLYNSSVFVIAFLV